MVLNLKSLVLRTDITHRPEEQEHNPRSRPVSPAPFLPPLSPLPSIEVTTPAGETAPVAPPPFEGTPTSYFNGNQTADWKEREAEFDRQFAFPPHSMPSQPPPAYTTTASPAAANLTNRQRRLNLPKLTPNHARVSSVNPAKSPIDSRRWHEKRRNIVSIFVFSLTLLLVALLLNYCYILPKLRHASHDDGSQSDVPSAPSLAGYWNMTTARLETVSAADTTVVDMCSSKDSEFERCVDSRFLASDAGEKFSFDLNMNDDGSFTGIFGEGIFSTSGSTEARLTPSRYGFMSIWINTIDGVEGKLSSEGCSYQRSALVLVTFEDGVPTYKITEKQMVASSDNCFLPQGRRDDSCQCTFIGTRPKSLKKRR
ncbi:hypothetical protein H072_9429 [Dactylellina haptotyla CBS 200.50]|uniref:Uncharacterized protein n=1 Tax=Dactylellina haptotyla (strain CBS 200.50) TaxID=1284197 RepID=S8BCQ6_DACHA|nr:hypothetical protein H072_9429 [Dactylellina haptotyla CBS 200.50]